MMPGRRNKAVSVAGEDRESTVVSEHRSPGAGDVVGSAPAPAEAAVGPKPVTEVALSHPGEWVLIRVLGTDEQSNEPSGEMLAHNPSRRAISKAVARAFKEDPEIHVCVILGGTRRLYGDALRQALADGAERNPTLNAWW
jgi:hypothetical protein